MAVATIAREVRRGTDLGTAYAGLGMASLGWASAFVLGKFALAEMTPLAVATWRYAVASLVLLPFAWRSRAEGSPGDVVDAIAVGEEPAMFHESQRASAGPLLPRRVAAALAVMVISGGVLYPWLFLGALARTSATNTSLLIALNPLLTLLLTPLVGERLGRQRLIGATLAFLGAILVICRENRRDCCRST